MEGAGCSWEREFAWLTQRPLTRSRLGRTSARERSHFHFKEALIICQRWRLIGSFTGLKKGAAALTGTLMASVIVGANIKQHTAAMDMAKKT